MGRAREDGKECNGSVGYGKLVSGRGRNWECDKWNVVNYVGRRSLILLVSHFEFLFQNRNLKSLSMKVCANIWTFPELMASWELMCDKLQSAHLGTTFSFFCLHGFSELAPLFC